LARRVLDRVLLGMTPTVLGLVLLCGIVGGAVGAGYLFALHVLQNWLWPTEWSSRLVGFAILGGVGLAVGLLTRLLGSPGDVELLVDNIHVSGGAPDTRTLRSLIPVSLLCISSGGGAGPEAPLVQTTGTLGSWIARRGRLELRDTRILTIAGMAAGFTVLFGAPMGSAVFSLEILHRRGLQYYEALVPALLGSLSGYAIYVVMTTAGLQPIWHIEAPGALHATDLGWAVLCGIAGAGVAVVFTYLNLWLRRGFRLVPTFVRPMVGGLALAGLGLWSTYALTFGEAQTGHVLSTSNIAVDVLAVAVVAKLLGTSVTISSGWRGGFIIPLFFMGATLGRLAHTELLPHVSAAVLCAALMASINVGVTKTPVGSTLVVAEMAGMRLLPTTLLASLVALMLTSEVGLIETQRERSGELTPDQDPLLDEGDDGAEHPDGDGAGGGPWIVGAPRVELTVPPPVTDAPLTPTGDIRGARRARRPR
jgi:H+/Cl- antiporter ClcA